LATSDEDQAINTSRSGIEAFSLEGLYHSWDRRSTTTQQTEFVVLFSSYVRNVFRCTPGGMRAWNDTLFVACAGKIRTPKKHKNNGNNLL